MNRMSECGGVSMGAAKPLKRAGAGGRLSIEIVDLPDLGRRWTKADVLRLGLASSTP
jgi:hypothetical protein